MGAAVQGGRFSEGDFTSQLLYVAIKTGVAVNIADMGMNVLCDLIEYAAKVDSDALKGKNTNRTPKMGIEGLSKLGRKR